MSDDRQTELSTASLQFAEQMFARYLQSPDSVGPDWRQYFEGLDASADPDALSRSVRGASLQPPTLFDPSRGRAPTPEPAEIEPQPRLQGRPGKPGRPAGDILGALRSVSLFRDVPEAELAHVAGISREVEFSEGEALFSAGDPGGNMYVVLSGSVLIQRAGRIVAELEPGEVLGEMAVLDGLPRSADAIARTRATLLDIAGSDLLGLLERRPVLARAIIRILSGRLRDTLARQDRVDQLIRAYRVRGHLFADLDPLGSPRALHRELDPEFYGFEAKDLGRVFSSRTIPGTRYMTLGEILEHLRNVYCKSIGVQYMHIDDLEIKDWLQEQLEGPGHRRQLTREEQVRILTKLTDAEIFEQFIHRKFLGAKRFSLEGAESLIPLLDLAIEESGAQGMDELIIGMAHRGRLNVLANVLGKSPRQIFQEFDDRDPDRIAEMIGAGDVKYHLGFSVDRKTACGKEVHLTLTFNPSHLECVGPVVLGRTRAKQDRSGDHERNRRMGIIIHGDSAFAGQGVVQEMLNMSELTGYRTGGTLHIIVNNQIGFTTSPESARSTQYATDVARMLQIPIFHVNGEHPQAVSRVIKLAMDFRKRFAKDVVIDMYCYRRYGHNETDEPTFTQPVLYDLIRKRKSTREGYLDSLLTLGEVTRGQADEIAKARRKHLEDELAAARSSDYAPLDSESGSGVWEGFSKANAPVEDQVDTAVPASRLSRLLLAQTVVPDHLNVHPKLQNRQKIWRQMAAGERPLDWSAAESLAFASLVADGSPVRLSGQDAGRGTFSHRHSVLHDRKDGHLHIPLQHVAEEQASFEVWDSPLTETGVLGFEYGYSLDRPDVLAVWEAQFGDFVNVAQVIIDQFISSGEDKWLRLSGLVMLLPHGYEGQGPEHSSARLERFLMLAAENNFRVCNLTTPAQIFHALRRQVKGASRKPLIVMSPKSLLRLPQAVSPISDLAQRVFMPIIEDETIEDPKAVRRVLLTSGKLYYELLKARGERRDVAIVRVEQYYPLRLDLLEEAFTGFSADVEVCWVQEEPRNMGAWPYLLLHVGTRLFSRLPLSVVSRPESASPATGSAAAHKIEQSELIERALELGGKIP